MQIMSIYKLIYMELIWYDNILWDGYDEFWNFQKQTRHILSKQSFPYHPQSALAPCILFHLFNRNYLLFYFLDLKKIKEWKGILGLIWYYNIHFVWQFFFFFCKISCWLTHTLYLNLLSMGSWSVSTSYLKLLFLSQLNCHSA